MDRRSPDIDKRSHVLLIFATLVLIIYNSGCLAEEIQPGTRQPLPDIRWQDADGNTHHLHDSHGKPRVLHFWASYCIPCRKEMPELIQWQSQNSDILLIPLSLDRRMVVARNFLISNNLLIPPLLVNDTDSSTLEIPVLPYTLFVTADGLFAGQIYGMAPWLESGFSAKVLTMYKP